MIEPLDRTHERYAVYRAAAVHVPERWLAYLQPDDRDAVLVEHKAKVMPYTHREKKTRKPGKRFSLACIHRGEPTGETRDCKSCGGVKQEPVYSCAVHGQCSTRFVDNWLHWCRTCEDKTAPTADQD